MGFSINTLSLFGLVLAIGLVVDDAIVVVEAVEHHIEQGLSPKEATLKAMEEVSGPVIAIAIILAAVFVPTAFIPGITGRLYQQFAVTIAVSVIISAFNALTLSPALSSLLLRPKKASRGPLAAFFRWFNRVFDRATGGYVSTCALLIRKSALSLLLLVGVTALTMVLGKTVPTGFLPEEDQGYLYAGVQLPDAASLQRTDAVMKQAEEILGKTPGVKYYSSIVGLQHVEQCSEHLQRLFLRHPGGLGGAQETGGEVRSHYGAPQPGIPEHPRGHRVRLFAAGHPRHRHCGRGDPYPRGPGGEGHLLPCRQRAESSLLQPASGRSWPA